MIAQWIGPTHNFARHWLTDQVRTTPERRTTLPVRLAPGTPCGPLFEPAPPPTGPNPSTRPIRSHRADRLHPRPPRCRRRLRSSSSSRRRRHDDGGRLRRAPPPPPRPRRPPPPARPRRPRPPPPRWRRASPRPASRPTAAPRTRRPARSPTCRASTSPPRRRSSRWSSPKEKGYFDKMCLDVDVKASFSTANYPLVGANTAQFASAGSYTEMLGFAKDGAELVAVGHRRQGRRRRAARAGRGPA